MKTDFKTFREPADVKKFFQQNLHLGSATPEEAFAFLDKLGLKHSNLIENNNFVHKVYNTQSTSDSQSSSYEYHVTSIAFARPTLLIFQNRWMLYFHFTSNKLADIDVDLVSVGL